MSSTTLRVHNPIFPIIGIVCGLLFLAATVMSILSAAWNVVPVFGVFTVLCLYLCLGIGPIDADAEGIKYTTRLGKYAIRWDEVTVLELDTLEQTLVLRGSHKQLAIPGPAAWMGKDKQALRALIDRQIQQRHIAVKQSPWTNFKLSKNTRVRS